MRGLRIVDSFGSEIAGSLKDFKDKCKKKKGAASFQLLRFHF